MPKPFAVSFYNSKAWKKCRNAYFNSVFGICENCKEERGEEVPGEEVHHKIFLTPFNINDPNITLNWDNLQLLCRDCHIDIHRRAYEQSLKDKHMKQSTEWGIGFDEDGNLIEKKKVTIVCGAPASGKTTYVEEHMTPGDLVVDLDLIKQSISMQGRMEELDNLTATAIKIRELLYDLIASKDVTCDHVWVVAGLPSRTDREELQTKLNAELVHIDTNKEECIRHAIEDTGRKNKAKQRRIINKYFEEVD